jgi:hypothetical protein
MMQRVASLKKQWNYKDGLAVTLMGFVSLII